MRGTRPGPRPLANALNETRGAPARLYARAKQLRDWEQHLLNALPREAGAHVRLARMDREELVVITDGPEWRHRLRYLAPRLQEHVFQAAGIRPRRVTVKVGDLPRRPERRSPRTLSPVAAQAIGAAADHIDNPPLAAALARLASRSNSATER